MQATYQLIGADGAEYGPVPLQQMHTWAKEGRIVGSTHVRRVGDENWATASSFPELGTSDRIGASLGEPAAGTAELEEIEKRIKGGGSWFFWIAALTVINTILVLAGANWTFMIGLSITQLVDVAVVTLTPEQYGLIAKLVVLVLDLAAAGFFVLLGAQAIRKRTWAFAVGITLYGLDTLLSLLSFSIISIGIHGWALFCFVVGLKAAQKWRTLEAAGAVVDSTAVSQSPASAAGVSTTPGQ